MYTNELDFLPSQVRRGAVSKKQAAMKIMETIYTNPRRFNIQDMDEDDRSEFLIDALPKFESIVERYNSQKSPFGAFLFYSIPGLRKTWTKHKNDDKTMERAMVPAIRYIYDCVKEKTLKVAMPALPEEIASAPTIPEVLQRNPLFTKTQTLKKRSALVLALKSAWYINDDHIDKISDFCGCSKDDIENNVNNLRTNLVEKNKKYRDLVERRDRAWYFVCKYRQQLAYMDKTCASYDEHKRKLRYQLRAWKNKNQLIQKSVQRIRPDNRSVAKALNLDPRKIPDYIRYAKELAERKESLI